MLMKLTLKRVIAICIFIFTFFVTMILLSQSPYANGWDGYYYIIQVRSWFVEGAMHSEDYSLIYPLIIAIQYIFDDYILSYKIASSLIRAFFVTAIFVLSVQIFKDNMHGNIKERSEYSLLPALAICSIASFSSSSLYFITQFPKNMLGFSFLLITFHYMPQVYKAIINKWFNRHDIVNIAMLFCFFIFTFVTHRYSGGIALITLLFYCMLLVLKRNRVVIISLLVIFVFFVLVVVSVPFLFPGTLHLDDLERFSGAFDMVLSLNFYSFLEIITLKNAGLLWSVELLIYYILSVMFLAYYVYRLTKKPEGVPIYLIGTALIVGLGVFPFYNFEPSGIGYRFYLGAQLFTPLTLIIFPIRIYQRSKKLVYGLLILINVGSLLIATNFDYQKFDPSYDEYQDMSKKLIRRIDNDISNYDLFVMHKALAEIFTFTTGLDALAWAPGDKYKSSRVMRIAYGVDPQLYREYLDVSEQRGVFLLQGHYTVLSEDLFNTFCMRLKMRDPASFKKINNWRNPMNVRPDYLMRGKKR